MPAAAPTNDPSDAPVTLRREETNAATVMIPAAATSAMAVAAFGFTDNSTRENANSTTPMTTNAPTGIRIGSRRLSRSGPSLIDPCPPGSPARRSGT